MFDLDESYEVHEHMHITSCAEINSTLPFNQQSITELFNYLKTSNYKYLYITCSALYIDIHLHDINTFSQIMKAVEQNTNYVIDMYGEVTYIS